MRSFRFLLASSLIITAAVAASAGPKASKPARKAAVRLTEQQRAIHALDRLTFGARPGDVQKVLAIGVDKWIDLQLHPEQIDDKAVETRVGPFRSVRMQTAQLVQNFPPQQLLRAIQNGKFPMPEQGPQKLVYGVQLAALREREQVQQQQQMQIQMKQGQQTVEPPSPNAPTPEQREAARALAEKIIETPRNQRVAMVSSVAIDELMNLKNLKPDVRDRLTNALTPDEREIFAAMVNPQQVVVNELMQNKLMRAIYSERQLQEVMTDFWFNHFNVYIYKDADAYLTTGYERDVIRPHVLGKFKDLLVATATSPAMLFYLDNAQSVGPNSTQAQNIAKRVAQTKAGQTPPVVPGLNENYGRELMELHTLGVEGGYTQKDVIEVAKCFTGWGVSGPQDGWKFSFDAKRHEPGDKYVLGHVIHENGQQEGMEVLDLLAHSPATARFISTKLARRFVSDNPPPSLIDQMAKTFLSTDGEIREVLRTMFHSKEFWSGDVYRAKVKTPLEFVVSAARATGADLQNVQPLIGNLGKMGMPLYAQQPPTGYSSFNSAWLNSDALIDRMNFALQLVNNKTPGTSFDPGRMLALGLFGGATPVLQRTASKKQTVPAQGPDYVLKMVENIVLAGDVSPKTDAAIRAQLADPKVVGDAQQDPTRMLNVMTALTLGSPEFQKR
jgi:uncharacterized protein (DUF1800 family)